MAKRDVATLAVIILFAVAGLGLVLANVPSYAKGKTAACIESSKAAELKLAFRSLWIDHIYWVRNVVLSTEYGDKEAVKVAEDQVVQDAKEIANTVSPYYGKEASDKLFGLLAGHYGAIKEYMNGTFGGDKKAMEVASGKLTKNADEIAAFLSSANPNWSKDTLESALVAHGGHHITEINEISKKDFSGDAKTWAAMKNHVFVIAGVLTDGIVKQFPDKFNE